MSKQTQYFRIWHGKRFVEMPCEIGRGGVAVTTERAIAFLLEYHRATKVEPMGVKP